MGIHRRIHPRLLLAIALSSTGAFLAVLAVATAHTVGGPCSSNVEPCEKWFATEQGPPRDAGERPDDFPSAIALNGTQVFAGVKAVDLNVADPYSSTASWTVAAHDLNTGTQSWRVFRRTRVYDSLLDLAVSPDGKTVVGTGGAYDAFPVGATDSRIVTVAYDAATGAERWSATWDGTPAGVDNGKVVRFSSDGRFVFVGGITTAAAGELNYVTIAYDALDGKQQWVSIYRGLGAGGTNALYDLAVSPDGMVVYVTGESAGTREYELDYATVAYDAVTGAELWVSRTEATFVDRACCLAVDQQHVYVTGDSYTGPRGGDYQALTLGLHAGDGSVAWQKRLGGSGYNGGRAIAASAGRVAVTTQSPPSDTGQGLTALTALYDSNTGDQLWVTPLAEPLRSQLANDLAIAPDGSRVYLIASSRPNISYTALYDQQLIAYNLSDGSTASTVHLDSGVGNALTGDKLAIARDGSSIITLGQITRSADPLGPPDQNIYDALVVAFPLGAPPSPTPTASPSASPTATSSPASSPSATPTATPTATATATPTATPTATATATPIATATASATTTPTPTATPSATATITPTPAPSATPSSTPAPAQLLNISTRLNVQTGDNVGIGGLIIAGAQSKNVIVRALGPSLSTGGHPIPGRLQDPILELHDRDGALIAFNDDWRDDPEQRALIQASGLAPNDDREAAIAKKLDPSSYTAVIRGKANGTGLALVETYDLDNDPDTRLANISTRGLVQTGDNVMIGGFIVGNNSPSTKVVVRAIGPSLKNKGVASALEDTVVELHDSNGNVFAFNDDWQNDAGAAEIQSNQLAPQDPRESATLQTLAPGSYTAIVRGKNDAIGVALVEVYNLR